MQRLAPVFPKLAAAFGALVFAAGSVLVFVIPNPKPKVDEKPETESTASYSIFPKPELWTPDFTPFTPKASPSDSKKPKAEASPSPSDSPRDVQPSRDDSPTPGKSDPVKPTTKPKATPTPTPKPASTPPKPKPTPTVDLRANAELRAQVIFLINQKRAQAGVGQLASNSHLSDQCQQWSTSMASRNVLQHSSMTYSGEIIASGATTAAQVVDLWMNSPAHRDIMLDGRYTLVGSGYVNGYWTVQFG